MWSLGRCGDALLGLRAVAPLEEERAFGSLELTEIDRNVVGYKGLDGRVTWHESLLPFFFGDTTFSTYWAISMYVLGGLDVYDKAQGILRCSQRSRRSRGCIVNLYVHTFTPIKCWGTANFYISKLRSDWSTLKNSKKLIRSHNSLI